MKLVIWVIRLVLRYDQVHRLHTDLLAFQDLERMRSIASYLELRRRGQRSLRLGRRSRLLRSGGEEGVRG